MMTKEGLRAQMLEEASKKAKENLAKIDAEVEARFLELQEQETLKKEVQDFAKSFPLITLRKWWSGIDDGMHTYFYKETGGVDTDGQKIRLAFFLLFWASDERLYVETDTYSKHQNPSCGYIGQIMHHYGHLQMSYDETENGDEDRSFLKKYLRSAFPEMEDLEKECKRMLKEVKSWSEEKKEMLDEVLDELCRVEPYEDEK